MCFEVGQKIVCINDQGYDEDLLEFGMKFPVKGKVYTVRLSEKAWTGEWVVLLEEIVNKPFPFRLGLSELRFLAHRFAPLDPLMAILDRIERIERIEQEELQPEPA